MGFVLKKKKVHIDYILEWLFLWSKEKWISFVDLKASRDDSVPLTYPYTHESIE